jgi:hypothetical protein
LKIIGEGTVSIYGNFNDSLELKPIIMYQAAGDGRNTWSTLQVTAEISNIGVYGKGCFDINGKPLPREIPPYQTNNQVGILSVFTTGLRLSNVYFRGLKEGLMLNNVYLSNNSNLKFDFCQRGIYEIQSHSNSYRTLNAYGCNKAFEFRSNKQVVSNLYAQNCKIGLHVGGANNTFISTYFENAVEGESQVIIGYNSTDSVYIPGLNGEVDGTNFIDLTIATTNSKKEIDTGFLMKESARRVFLSGGYLYTSIEAFTSPLNQIISVGAAGIYASPNVFKIDPDANFKSIKIDGLKAPAGQKLPLYIDDKGNIVR